MANDPEWVALPGVLEGQLARRRLSLASEQDARLIQMARRAAVVRRHDQLEQDAEFESLPGS